MQFVLAGFTPDTGFRIFKFEGIGDDRSRTEFTVRADLALSRKYGIQMQDLPLLCRGLLDRLDENEFQMAWRGKFAERGGHNRMISCVRSELISNLEKLFD